MFNEQACKTNDFINIIIIKIMLKHNLLELTNLHNFIKLLKRECINFII
jgi:hypothetical protein